MEAKAFISLACCGFVEPEQQVLSRAGNCLSDTSQHEDARHGLGSWIDETILDRIFLLRVSSREGA
jgi:hypothetical protein